MPFFHDDVTRKDDEEENKRVYISDCEKEKSQLKRVYVAYELGCNSHNDHHPISFLSISSFLPFTLNIHHRHNNTIRFHLYQRYS